MHGVAVDRMPWFKRFVWLVPAVLIQLGVAAYGSALGLDVREVLASASGCLGGVVWQVVYRRDLADRLLLFTVAVVFLQVMLLLPSVQSVDEPGAEAGSAGTLLALVGVLAGLVLTEHVLRWRDTRRERAESLQIVMNRHADG